MMKFIITLLISFFCYLSVFANELTDLGDSSQLIISAKEEQAIARAILKEVAVSPEIVQDIEVIDYLRNLGDRLVAYSPNKRQQFNFFVVNERKKNKNRRRKSVSERLHT